MGIVSMYLLEILLELTLASVAMNEPCRKGPLFRMPVTYNSIDLAMLSMKFTVFKYLLRINAAPYVTANEINDALN